MDSHSGIGLIGVGENFDPSLDLAGFESSDSFEGAPPADNGGPPKKKNKKFHRHTPQQIQELESFFKYCPHPDEKQKTELGLRLGLQNKQIKFWFQNRRTQLKTQIERHENETLKQENDRLRAENGFLKQEITSRICNNCGGPEMPGEISLEWYRLSVENARLKDEISRISAAFPGRPSSSSADPSPCGSNNGGNTWPMGFEVDDWAALMPLIKPCVAADELPYDRSALVDVAVAAMDELLKMAQVANPLWTKGLHQPSGYTVEAPTRETGLVLLRGLALVETLMDANRWAEMFPCLIASAATVDVLSSGTGGTRDNALQVMDAEFQVLSPLAPIRRVRFVRFCKQHSDGLWAVVDVSIDPSNAANQQMLPNCRRLPSGCIIQDMDKYSKVTWVEHSEYDESTVHHLLRPLLGSGHGFGAQRWIATLQRQCHRFAQLMSPAIHGMTAASRKSMLKLARRMTCSFTAGICASSVIKWGNLNVGNAGEDVRIMVRKNENCPGEPCGVVLSAATTVWMPITQQRLFDFLRDERNRCQWDILSNGRSMPAMFNVVKGPGQGDCVTLFSTGLPNSGMVILQETWSDASGALIVYAPVDEASMSGAMNSGDSSQVVILPSGFAIFPSASPRYHGETGGSNSSGCLLTVGFQLLVKGPGGKLTPESVETVGALLSGQVEKIKVAFSVT
ncbi:ANTHOCYANINLESS 2, ARABIDOPSIS THALIANA HOMEODOMAIN PROTEIN [Hibiscus trionum]|uniref:ANTHOCYANINLESS 2, ARABIDOPSIS THALIANA HOMEODOMAIN PROTEIN n=1 Tax=Hibiscus trionum TaxID=183268 RepID=A0A9W7LSX8_HIBTR|nr:ANTHOCYANINLESS 2, ARABIDOPSIS THALIANA HOMEODOMAIN PROTEIN [Hibiscus trionum]